MEILKTLFNMSMTGSIILLIFLLLRGISKRHFNSSWHYKMLILVLLFFIIPVNNFIELPTIPMLNTTSLEMQRETIPESKDIKINISNGEEKKGVKDNTNFIIDNQEDIAGNNMEIQDINPSIKESQSIYDIGFNMDFFLLIFKYIWLIGMISLGLLRITSYIKFKSSILKYSVEIERNDIREQFKICKNKLKINRQISLRICNNIASPMLMGIFNPIVIIPNLNEEKKRLKMIFLHELNHYKRKDILIKVFSLIINIIHWFNPLVYILVKEIDKYCEYSIDEKVVEEMDINDRKYYGETILNLVGNSMLKTSSFTTSMGSNGKQLKTRLENMIYSFKTTRKKQILSLFIGILILVSGLTVACSILPSKAVEGNNSFVVYPKDDGLYYSFLDDGDEVRIHEGKEFSHPLISKTGDYIAYTKDKSLYIYDIKNNSYEKITEKQDIYDNFYDWIDDEIVYSTEEPGFTIYNPLTKEKKEHLDEYHYGNFKSSNKNFLYGKQTREWSTEEGDFVASHGIVEIDLNNYDGKDNKFGIETIIEAKPPSDAMLGYDPTIANITEDGRYVFIMEKFQSASTSADYGGIGLYDTVERIHIDFTDIYGEEDGDLIVLPHINNIAINTNNSDLIGIIKGGFRERFMNKKMALLSINNDKSYDIVNLTDNSLVAMTPSFTLAGDKLLYSATGAIDPNSISDFNEAYREWENQPHNIYEYDLKNSQMRKLTKGNNFDFMPISISDDGILICRLQDNGNSQLVKIVGQKEDIIANDITTNYFTETNIDVFISKKAINHTSAKLGEEIDKKSEAYKIIDKFMKEHSKAAFSPYYELLDFQISNYVENNLDEGVEATFYYKIINKNYDKDPDTVGYIKEAKESGNKNYQQMYDEYLEPREMNFDLKIVIDKDDIITLYSNISPNGIQWEETDMSDFLIK